MEQGQSVAPVGQDKIKTTLLIIPEQRQNMNTVQVTKSQTSPTPG